jgi:hypothetical protein
VFCGQPCNPTHHEIYGTAFADHQLLANSLETDMTLHIASMMPDRALEESAIGNAITSIAMDLAGLRDHPLQKRCPVLDLVFLLPNHQDKADFDGLRLHSFDPTTQTILMESSVPQKMVTSIHAERYVIAVMLDAIDAASEFFNEQHILFDAPGHQSLIESATSNEQLAIH